MRLIGTVLSESDARRLGDFLFTAGMPAHVEQGSAGDWQVWIEHDDHIEQATAQLHAFVANPNDPQYAEVESAARKARREAAKQAERRQKNFRDVRTKVFGDAAIHATPITLVLIGASILIAISTQFGTGEGPAAMAVRELFVFQPGAEWKRVVMADDGATFLAGRKTAAFMFSSVARGEAWRLVTPIFLHFHILHLLFNMSWLSTLGRMIESRRGQLSFGTFVLASAIVSNLAQALWTVYGPGVGYSQFGGMSGVGYALFGYAWLTGRLRPYEKIGVPPQATGMMLGWLVICMVPGLVGNVANAAHVGGLAVGALVGAWPTLVRKMRAR